MTNQKNSNNSWKLSRERNGRAAFTWAGQWGWVGINNFGQRQQLTFLRFRLIHFLPILTYFVYIWIQTGAIISLIVSFETHPRATVLK